MDLPGWQEIHDELDDSNLKVISAAQDTGGEEAAGEWFDRAEASFVQIIDPQHTLTALYNFVNVPSAVWIDEDGYVVRKDDGAWSKKWTFGSMEAGSDQYRSMIRDWVEKGANSEFVFTRDEIRTRIGMKSPDHIAADLNFRLGVYFHLEGNAERADQYWQAAQRLSPDNWNYHRQDWVFDPEERRIRFPEKMRALGDRPFYRPLELQTGKRQ